MNNDVCTEILLHLPVESLLRFRAVCKFWCYVIDSPSFRELHINNNNNNNVSDDMARLELYFNNGQLRVLHNTKPLLTYKSDQLMGYEFSSYLDHQGLVRLYGPVMGLACIYDTQLRKPIAICNPCLHQLKLLPPITTSSYSKPYRPCKISQREVAIGFDEDYKVAQLLLCSGHFCLHGLMYSRKTDSWKDLAGVNGNLKILSISPMKQVCENGRFAHWYVVSATGYSRAEAYILSLDMKNEVFQTIRLFQGHWNSTDIVVTYVAEDEHSFWRLDLPRDPSRNRVTIYRSSSGESRYRGRIISWAPLMNVQFPFSGELGLWRRTSCVLFKYWNYMFVFDYRACKYSYWPCCNHFPVLFKHRCSFVSLENVS
ncbi:hypothetical protein SASPL_153672 [Salvia splendens]|uniref:F-box domain-containing protein n=1 Tax=Salvia splendens TaxID=180675 RepID=A0A8X8YYK1_SALSN|nr:F-box protein At5g49610-like [Salvia splendens]KAG6384853.1 hypothetical protein SASPL_153672 [Salvia splendens]